MAERFLERQKPETSVLKSFGALPTFQSAKSRVQVRDRCLTKEENGRKTGIFVLYNGFMQTKRRTFDLLSGPLDIFASSFNLCIL